MGYLISCEVSPTAWGNKTRFRQAKVGLVRVGQSIYIAVFSNKGSWQHKLDPQNVELLPFAIRFNNMATDLFINPKPYDLQQYHTMLRRIKVILMRDRRVNSGKLDKYEEFIRSIPTIDSIDTRELKPAQRSTKFVHSRNSSEEPLRVFSEDERKRLQYLDGLERIIICGYLLPRNLLMRDSLSALTLTDCNLTCVPKQLENLSNRLNHLDLSNNKIVDLPRSFCCKMNNLRVLNLSHNLIQQLPIEIKFFSRLGDLDLSFNHLRMLPSTFSDLKSLTHLNVEHNQLRQLPAFRIYEVRLRKLDIGGNLFPDASSKSNTFEVYPSLDDDSLSPYNENLYCPMNCSIKKQTKIPKLFELALLRTVRSDRLLKLASEESLPRTIISRMQRETFKCFKCGRLNILPAYNTTDTLDYLDHVEVLNSTNDRHTLTFMKLICRNCFDSMSS